jgi:hypothetical protein
MQGIPSSRSARVSFWQTLHPPMRKCPKSASFSAYLLSVSEKNAPGNDHTRKNPKFLPRFKKYPRLHLLSRHLKYPDFNDGYIKFSCRTVIAKLRALQVCEEISREIWVRRTAQTWYRYLLLPGSIKFFEREDPPCEK